MACPWKIPSCGDQFKVKRKPTYPPAQRENLLWAAVDFDNTIATSTWSAAEPNALPGEPLWDNITKLDELRSAGYKIVVHSSRPWSDYELLESYLQHHHILFDKIVCGKLLAAIYVDDRALNASALDWSPRVD